MLASGTDERAISSSITAAAAAGDDTALGDLYSTQAATSPMHEPRMAEPLNLQRMRKAGAAIGVNPQSVTRVTSCRNEDAHGHRSLQRDPSGSLPAIAVESEGVVKKSLQICQFEQPEYSSMVFTAFCEVPATERLMDGLMALQWTCLTAMTARHPRNRRVAPLTGTSR